MIFAFMSRKEISMFKKIKNYVEVMLELALGTIIGLLFFLLAPLIGFVVFFIVIGEVIYNIYKWTITPAKCAKLVN